MTAARTLRLAILWMPVLAGACAARRTHAVCDRPVFLYTEHRSTSKGRVEERPVYGCARAGADTLAPERRVAR